MVDESVERRQRKSQYDQEYIKKYRDKITILAEKGSKEKWREFAAGRDQSMNAFIIECVEKEIFGE